MYPLVNRLHDWPEQQIPCLADAAAKNDFLRTDDSQNVTDSDPQIHPCFLQDAFGNGVALQGSLDDRTGVDAVQIMIHQLANARGVPMHDFFYAHCSDGGSGGVQFQAALSTAAAGKPIHLNYMVTEFTCRSADAKMELSVHHHAAPYSGANRQTGNRVGAATRAEGPLSQRDRADVVDESHRKLHLLFDHGLERDIQPLTGQIRQKLYNTRIEVRRARHTDAHSPDQAGGSIRLGQLSDQLHDPSDHRLLSLIRQSWALPLVEDLTCIRIGDGGTEVCSTKVNANIVIHKGLFSMQNKDGTQHILRTTPRQFLIIQHFNKN